MAPPEHFWFDSKRGARIHNMIVRPAGFDPAKKYPLFVMMHGGPHTMWRDTYFLRWNYHLLAAPGYVVAADELHRLDRIRRALRAGHPGRSARRADARDQPGCRRGDRTLPVHRRQPPMRRRRELRRPSRELAASEHRSLSLPDQPRRPDQPRKPVGNERHHLLAREEHGRPAVAAGRGLEQAESDPLRAEVEDAGAGDGRRARLPRAAEQHAGILVGAPAPEDREPPAGVSRTRTTGSCRARTAASSTAKCTTGWRVG